MNEPIIELYNSLHNNTPNKFLINNYRQSYSMNKKSLAELLKYSSPFSILVVTYKDEIVELHTPFYVLLKNDAGILKKGMKASVELVKLSFDLKTVFVIDMTPYYYWHFDILIVY